MNAVKLVVTVSTTVSMEGEIWTYDCHGGDGEEGIDDKNRSSSFGVGIEVAETDSKEKATVRKQHVMNVHITEIKCIAVTPGLESVPWRRDPYLNEVKDHCSNKPKDKEHTHPSSHTPQICSPFSLPIIFSQLS